MRIFFRKGDKMKKEVLNRIRQGNYIAAEVPHDRPRYRKYVTVSLARPRSPFAQHADQGLNPGETYRFEIRVKEERVSSKPRYEKGFRLLEVYKAEDEDEMLMKLSELVPSTDVFDVPWRVFVP